MLNASITFFILGIISFALGASGVANLSVEIGRILLIVFLILSVLSFFIGRRPPRN